MRCCRKRLGNDVQRRWRRWLSALALLAVLAASLPWLLPPERIADLLLRQIGPGLQLEISRSGKAAWRLRGGPMLEIYGLEISEIGADTPWLAAERALIAVPWRTVRGLGQVLDATRIELDAPILELAALRHWLDTRTPGAGDAPLPTVAEGIYLRNGELHADGWQIDGISIQVQRIAADAPVRGKLLGRYTDHATQAEIDLRLALTRPAPSAGAAIVGAARIQRDNTAIPLQFTLSAPLRHGRIRQASLALTGEFSTTGTAALPFTLNIRASPDFGDTIALSPLALELTGSGPLPSLTASGSAAFAEELAIQLDGELPHWPAAWPALPAPLDQRGAFGFSLDYTGAADLSGLLHLHLDHGPTRLDAAIGPQQLSHWLTRAPTSPLPPLQAHLSTPTLELPGVTLSGVEITSEP